MQDDSGRLDPPHEPGESDILPGQRGAIIAPGLLEDLRRTFEPRFEVGGLLGTGGMGVVVELHDPVLNRSLALKLLTQPAILRDPTARERLFREARAAAMLSHPNVVTVLEVGETAVYHEPYILMERIVGSTLERHGVGGEPIGVPSAIQLLTDVAEALAAAHARGLIHRDLKPGNIMLRDATGQAVVLDFGISHWTPAAQRSDVSLTGEGVRLGTPLYMSPEQAAGEPVCDRSDIYSLGCVMYELLTGAHVFTGPSAMAVLAAHIKDSPAPLQARCPDLPVELSQAVMAMLQKEPAARPSADDIRRQFAPIPEFHPWDAPQLVMIRQRLRSAGLLGIALAVVAIVEGAGVASGEYLSASSTPVTDLWAVGLLWAIGAAYFVQAVRAIVAVRRADLSHRLVLLLAGDAWRDTGLALDRRQRYARLSPPELGALLRARAAWGGGLIFAGPAVLLCMAATALVRPAAGLSWNAAVVLFSLPLIGLLALGVGRDRTERQLLGSTGATLGLRRATRLVASVRAWLTSHQDQLNHPRRHRPQLARDVLAAGLLAGIACCTVALGLTQALASTWSGARIGIFARVAAEITASAQPILDLGVLLGGPHDPDSALLGWADLYGIGRAGEEHPASVIAPIDHSTLEALFGVSSRDPALLMEAALDGLAPAQLMFLSAESSHPLIPAFRLAALGDRDPGWEFLMRYRPPAHAASTGFDDPDSRRREQMILVRSLSARQLLRAARAAGVGMPDSAELVLLEALRVSRLQAEAARSSWELALAGGTALKVGGMLGVLYERTAQAPLPSQLRPDYAQFNAEWRGAGTNSAAGRAEILGVTKRVIRDSSQLLGIRWQQLRDAREASCGSPTALWTGRDRQYEELSRYARDSLAKSAIDTAIIASIDGSPRTWVGFNHSSLLGPLLGIVEWTGHSLAAGCAVLALQ